MKSVKKVLLVLVVAILGISVTFLLNGCEKKKSAVKETFKIGLIAPLSGPAGYLGEGMKNAIFLAKDHLKDTKYNYEILVEDDQLDPKMTASAASNLLDIDKVDVVMSVEAAMAAVIAPMVKSHDKLSFGITAVSSNADGEYSFLHWTPAMEQAAVIVNEFKNKGIKKVAIFRSVSLEDWTAYVDALKKLVADTDIKIVAEHSFTDDTKDFRSMIAQAKSTKPDIYFLVVPTPAVEILTKQLKEAGNKAPLTSIESFEVTEQPELFEGYWYSSASEPNQAYRDAYQAKYNKNQTICSANIYDMFNLTVRAIEDVQSEDRPTRAQIAAELKKIRNFPGALGNLSVGDDGVVVSKAQLKMIKDGKVTPIGE
ncbi:MAG: ABC transporter substrate-binding protein [Nitrospirota bacterium]